MYKVLVHAERDFRLKLLLLQIGCLCAIGLAAKTYATGDDITFAVSIPVKTVEAGDQFRLSFIVSSSKELSDVDIAGFSATIPKELTVLMGPSRSKSSKIQVIEGKTISDYQINYTYILSVPQAGTFTIPAASITFKGNTLRSQPLTFTALPAGESSPADSQQSLWNTFISMTVSERSPRVNTPVVLECKLYTVEGVDSLTNINQYISLDDFKVESVVLRDNKWQLEHWRGKNYQTIVFRKLLLYPLRTGELRIDNLHVDAYIRKLDETIDPFDAFFNDRNAASTKKRLHCTGITFHVRE